MRILIVALTAGLILTGCVSSGIKITDQQLSGFHEGVTTESQGVAKLGVPTATSQSSSGDKVLVYSYVHAAPKASSYIPVVGLVAGGATADSSSVVFIFDAKGVLKSRRTSTSHTDTKTGLAS